VERQGWASEGEREERDDEQLARRDMKRRLIIHYCWLDCFVDQLGMCLVPAFTWKSDVVPAHARSPYDSL